MSPPGYDLMVTVWAALRQGEPQGGSRYEAAAPHEFPSKDPCPKYSVPENSRFKVRGLNVSATWQKPSRSMCKLGKHRARQALPKDPNCI